MQNVAAVARRVHKAWYELTDETRMITLVCVPTFVFILTVFSIALSNM